MINFQVYKARFTPRSLNGRYADPDTAHLFEEEMGYRLGHVTTELRRIDGSMELSPDKRMIKISGSRKPTPPRTENVHFQLIGFKDTEETSGGYSCEIEVAFAANSIAMPKWMKETLEDDLLPEIEVSRDLKYVTVREKPNEMPEITFAEYLTI